jgi:anti-sigma factor ChrR (cupin superfamily)/CheY-like chemotaxis protein
MPLTLLAIRGISLRRSGRRRRGGWARCAPAQHLLLRVSLHSKRAEPKLGLSACEESQRVDLTQTGATGRVLIVEDEYLVALHLQGVLEDLGFVEVHWAHSLEAAERALKASPPALAILDINVGPALVFPFAEQLRRLGIPFLFSSARPQLPAEWSDCPLVPKPLDQAALAVAIQRLKLDRTPSVAMTTLGDVLYADCRTAPPEQEWFALVRGVAAGDQLALHRLYERAHDPVLTLSARITGSFAAAEDVCIEVFHDLWRRVGEYDGESGSVLGWIMNLARSRAFARMQADKLGAPARQDRSRAGVDAVRLQARLSLRVAMELGGEPVMPPARTWREPQWEAVAPGIACKLLAADADKHRVSMLVRLAPGGSYPAHTHAGVEELHLLEGELWIDERKLYPGDYNYGEPGAGDDRVWSETGCACVLITSTRDVLR